MKHLVVRHDGRPP